MKIKSKDIIYYSTYAYLMLNFFALANDTISRIIDLLYFGLITISIILFIKRNKTKVAIKELLLLFTLGILISIQLIFNRYGISDTLKVTIVMIVAYFLSLNNLATNANNNKIDIIYLITIICLTSFLLQSYHSKTLFTNISGLANGFYLPSLGDKNLSSIAIFFFLYYCRKNKRYLGAALAVLYIALLGSRMTYLGLILFAIIEILNKYKKINYSFIQKNIAWILIISQIIVFGISYYVTYNISTSSIAEYKSSIMDGSNAMRARSNVYALEAIRNNPRFIVFGYDSQILKVMGIEDIKNSARYMGYRLVQPHSLLLNLIMRHGIIYSIIYLSALLAILKRIISPQNMPLLLTYIFMNMVLHSLFSSLFLLFFIFDMNLTSRRNNSKRRKHPHFDIRGNDKSKLRREI